MKNTAKTFDFFHIGALALMGVFPKNIERVDDTRPKGVAAYEENGEIPAMEDFKIVTPDGKEHTLLEYSVIFRDMKSQVFKAIND
jgi:hypothetical protein